MVLSVFHAFLYAALAANGINHERSHLTEKFPSSPIRHRVRQAERLEEDPEGHRGGTKTLGVGRAWCREEALDEVFPRFDR